jgi:hypothetical protein
MNRMQIRKKRKEKKKKITEHEEPMSSTEVHSNEDG